MIESPLGNRLLASLPSDLMGRLRPRLTAVGMTDKQRFLEPGSRIEHVYFPDVGVVSMLMSGAEGELVEVATVGREGFVGTALVLETEEASTIAFCQVPGSTQRMSANDFREALPSEPVLRRKLLRYTQALMTQMAQNATCNRIHDIQERAARWLLMTHDRVDGDVFPLTQEFLAQMLGVRRQAVNIAAGILQQAGLINYTRGVITILDRLGLEGASCERYGIIRSHSERLLSS